MSEILDSHSAQTPDSGDAPPTACSFALWAQLAPLPDGTTQEQVDEVERELAHPDGRDVAHLPQPSLDAIAWSQNCNIVLKLKNSQCECIHQASRRTCSYSPVISVADGRILAQDRHLRRIRSSNRIDTNPVNRQTNDQHKHAQCS